MTTLNMDNNKSDAADRELSIDELEIAAGGCPGWLGPVAVAVAAGAALRMGFESVVRRLF